MLAPSSGAPMGKTRAGVTLMCWRPWASVSIRQPKASRRRSNEAAALLWLLPLWNSGQHIRSGFSRRTPARGRALSKLNGALPIRLGPVHAIFAAALCTRGAGCKAQARSNAECLARACNAADGSSGAQPVGKGSFGPSLGVALLAWAASPCASRALMDGPKLPFAAVKIA